MTADQQPWQFVNNLDERIGELTRTAAQAMKAGVMAFKCHLRVRDFVLMERVLAGGAGLSPVMLTLRAALGPWSIMEPHCSWHTP